MIHWTNNQKGQNKEKFANLFCQCLPIFRFLQATNPLEHNTSDEERRDLISQHTHICSRSGSLQKWSGSLASAGGRDMHVFFRWAQVCYSAATINREPPFTPLKSHKIVSIFLFLISYSRLEIPTILWKAAHFFGYWCFWRVCHPKEVILCYDASSPGSAH